MQFLCKTWLCCFGVTAIFSWGWLKLMLIEVEVDWSWGWLKLRLIEVKVKLCYNLWNVFEVSSCRLITLILFDFLSSDFGSFWAFLGHIGLSSGWCRSWNILPSSAPSRAPTPSSTGGLRWFYCHIPPTTTTTTIQNSTFLSQISSFPMVHALKRNI